MAGLQSRFAKLGIAFATLLLAASIAPSYALAGQADNVSGGGEEAENEETSSYIADLLASEDGAQPNDTDEAEAQSSSNQLVKWSRLAGTTRVGTMQKISQKGFTSCSRVIVASADNSPDALAATALAGTLKASGGSPILLTDSKSLSSEVSSEIKRLGASEVFIVGGTSAVSSAVESSIKGISGVTSVKRLAGESRFDTAINIYEAGKDTSGWNNLCIIASGVSYPDALSISPLAYAARLPIFLADGSGNLSDATKQAIKDGGFTKAVIVGGTAVVSDDTASWLKELVGSSSRMTRLWGNSRYDTSEAIAEYSIDCGMHYTNAAYTSGENFPDALAGGAFCGKTQSPIMLVGKTVEGSYPGIRIAGINKRNATNSYVLGGTAAVPDSVYSKLQEVTTDVDLGNYWIAPAKRCVSVSSMRTVAIDKNSVYLGAESDVVRTQSQIDADVKKMRAGDQATINLYKSYMNGDKYHLYTKWNGSTTDMGTNLEDDTAENGYIEFRIIQVGDHDGDGSVLTFQATNGLAQAYSLINSTKIRLYMALGVSRNVSAFAACFGRRDLQWV